MKAVIGFGNTNREIKMKIKSIFVAVLLMAGVVVAPTASAAEIAKVISFSVTPDEIELTGANTILTFELVVSHPNGIENTSTLLTLKSSANNSIVTYLNRTDANIAATNVVFKGSLSLPRDIEPGVYKYSTVGLKNNSSAGYQFDTGTIEGGKIRTLVGAENGVLVRSGGDLKFDYATFYGPTHDSTQSFPYENTIKYNSQVKPIWKVGETYNPSDYFELRVPGLALNVKSFTPDVCAVTGKLLSFVKEGSCSYSVSTAKTLNYKEFYSNQTATISTARIKPVLMTSKLPNQDVKSIGESISIPGVYGPSQFFILPVSQTPSICIAGFLFVKILSGGTCKLTYQSDESPTLLASDLYMVSFEILKDGQPVAVPTPTPVATPTAKPVVKKTITCVKGKKTIKKTAVSPKCPAGYKLKK
jgi:hypothetical protein